MMLAWWMAAAVAGNLYINGTYVEPASLRGVTLEKVTVRFDESGNMLVEAPGYKIEVVDPAGAQATPPPPPPGGGAPAVGAMTTAPPQTSAAQPTPPASNVTRARWWLVTEDNGSAGHTIEVWVNGQLVQTIRSGDPRRILDVGGWLRVGSNDVVVKSTSVNPGGGTFYVYMGTGGDQGGTFVMDQPQVQFGVGATRTGPYQREYTLNVDR